MNLAGAHAITIGMHSGSQRLSERISPWVATFFGVGLAPKAPGTFGSLAALPVFLLIRRLSLKGYLSVIAGLSLAGLMAAHSVEKRWGEDPSQVVIDEVVGMLLTLISRPKGLIPILAAFLIFRALDILKPPPVGTLDRTVKGGVGIMADDMAAGLIGALILTIVRPQAERLWMRRS
ncbi:MAG TPA: phosphatidylglycerophosphatase A [Deltaproteobacteria bacterium]|nr:phosphatidylglycerophosphatase A [Deltaproteobacteria bacterium]